MTDEQFKQLMDAFGRILANHVPLREHIDTRIQELKDGIVEARRQMELKMDGFPAQFLRKGEVDATVAEMRAQLCELMDFRAKAEGMASQRSLEIVRWVSIVGIILSLIGILLRHYQV